MNASYGVKTSSSYDWTFLFHGEFIDNESGLYNYGYRYYDSQLGRWLSRDPIGEFGGLNTYVFARNGPISLRDQYGLTACSDCAQALDDCYAEADSYYDEVIREADRLLAEWKETANEGLNQGEKDCKDAYGSGLLYVLCLSAYNEAAGLANTTGYAAYGGFVAGAKAARQGMRADCYGGYVNCCKRAEKSGCCCALRLFG